MTVGELKNMVMFQTNNDAEDLGDYTPYLLEYLNEGYDRLMDVYAGKRVGDGAKALGADTNEPELPGTAHRAIADYATWMIYRNGNVSKQQRGVSYLQSFQEALTRLREGKGKTIRQFSNIPC